MARKLCFVIMPFASKFVRYYSAIYAPAIAAAGLRGRKADTDVGPETLWDSIRGGIARADVVLAELTGKRSNVSYEVGYAHAKNKPVILIAQSMKAVPSDIQHLRVVRYSANVRGWQQRLKQGITAALKAVMSNPGRYRPRNVMRSTRGKLKAGQTRSQTVQDALRIAARRATRPKRLTAVIARRLRTVNILRINRAVPSQIRQLEALLKDRFNVQMQWKGEGEEYTVSWDASRGPDVSNVAGFAQILGMVVGAEGRSA